ncbi:hypothetical protein DFR24_3515 [Panacagrimonas perspica]|uniref:Uncharacterized protein n=1 Tax=Panacagrimonas perspica TaxID=381431 RepID=A0A4S3K312_9GAMM|nr:DUF6632 domain-containing protein [Panacagrimonas perspica]TDU26489.1 hypothetical protein DFR24_3515 [Panacagrimonas perspica]THD02104.1 hypothetical protein B1810_16645 [Panacagrimonas perspica]
MKDETREKYLKVALMVFGLFLLVGLYPLMNWLWPDGWAWEPRQTEYEQMIQGIYATMGIFLIIASRKPREHRSLIQFTIWSSVVHAGIMAAQATHDHHEHANLIGDVPALFAMAAVLWFLLPKGGTAAAMPDGVRRAT